MKLKTLLTLGLLLTMGITKAQSDFRQGYVVKITGDTLYGEIDYRGDIFMGASCTFRSNPTAVETKCTIKDINEYRFIDQKYFVAKDLPDGKQFLEFLIKGKVNIYYLRNDKGDHYFIEKEGMGLTELPYEEGIKRDSLKKMDYFYETKKHIGILSYYMQDAPQFKERIELLNKPGHRGLVKLAEDYHKSTCKDGLCIIYEKPLPFLKANIEVLGGLCQYFQESDLGYQGAILADVWMPRVNEKIYFRTGFVASKVKVYNHNYTIYKVPIQLEYIYPKGIFRPKCAYGLNLTYLKDIQTGLRDFSLKVAFMAGLNIRLQKKIYLVLNYDIDFTPNDYLIIIPSTKFSHSFSTGLQFNF